MPLGIPQTFDPNKAANAWGQFPWGNTGSGTAAPSAPTLAPPAAPATPALSPAPAAPAAGVPGSQPTDWGSFGGNDTPFAPPTTGPGAPAPTAPATPTQDPSTINSPLGGLTLEGLLAALGQGGDPSSIFSGTDVFGLPGRSKAGEANSQLIAQMLAYLAQQQGPRSEQAEGLIKGLSDYQNPAWAGMQEALGASRNRLGSMDALRSALTGTAQTGAAQTRQNTMQGLRDQGGFGMGAAGFDPYAQAENLAGTQYGQSLRDIELALSAEEGNRIGQLGQLGGQAANVYGQTVAQPDTAYAELLRMQQNPALAALLDYMNQQAQTAVGGDVAFRAQPNDFERIGLPIISGLTGAAGNILGAPQSTTNYYGGG